MGKRNDLKVIFKTYNQAQAMLLPPSLEELIAANHPVRIVSKVIEQVDLQPLMKKYKAGGTSSFHPQMLLKVMVYAYINNTYSSRRIEEALTRDIHFMWLSGMSTPDHNTIARFRSERLAGELQQIFTRVAELLMAEGLLNIKELYHDGTKIEANANRYTFVWGKAIKTSKERIKKQLSEVWQYAKGVAATELDDDSDPSGFPTIDAEKVEQTIDKINAALQDKPVRKEIKQKLGYAKKNWPQNLKKYEAQEKIIGEGRTSYSKTDTDATFMRMKEDHMKNGQLKPAYNVQISTNNQFIATYSLHQKTTDTATLIPHFSQHEENFHTKPEAVITDAGYGSQENLAWAEDNQITAYIKHNQFDRNQNKKIRDKTPFAADKLFYNREKEYYVCPMGQHMELVAVKKRKTTTGFKQSVHVYRAQNCEGCPLRGVCHKAGGNRTIEVNHNLNRLKRKADELLLSEKGIVHRKRRPCDVEPVFGNIKANHHFKRFMLRGIEKVEVETGLLALAHNLRKKIAATNKKAA
jgi:transposase